MVGVAECAERVAVTGLCVPNQFPAYQTGYRIAIIGDSPSKDDLTFGKPFLGKSGNFLAALLSIGVTSPNMHFLGARHQTGYPTRYRKDYSNLAKTWRSSSRTL